MSNIHAGHRERLRKTYTQSGLSAFHDHQALELLLTYAIPRIDVNPLAHALIQRFGSLRGVLEANIRDLMEVKGIGEQAAILLSLSGRIYDYATGLALSHTPLSNPSDAMLYCKTLLSQEKNETCYVICLDFRGCVLHTALLSRGTVAQTAVFPRNIVELAIRYHASSVILTHNHPSGNVEPSKQDRKLTQDIILALNAVGASLYDHIIVGKDRAYSLKMDQNMDFKVNSQTAEIAAERKE